jgi:hypothetical protein
MTDIPNCPLCKHPPKTDGETAECATGGCDMDGWPLPLPAWRALPRVVEDAAQRVHDLITAVGYLTQSDPVDQPANKECVAKCEAAVLSCMVVPPKGAGEDRLALWAHLTSEHAAILPGPWTYESLADMHAHEHKGPGTIRNHPEDSRASSLKKIANVLEDAEDEDVVPAAPPVPPAPTTDTGPALFQCAKCRQKWNTEAFMCACPVENHKPYPPAPVEPPADADALIDAFANALDDTRDCATNGAHRTICVEHKRPIAECRERINTTRAALKARIHPAPASQTLVDALNLTILAKLRERNAIYRERNSVVAGFAYLAQRNGWDAYRTQHVDIPNVQWDADWRTVIIIEIPTGQISWHVHDSDVDLFTHLPYREVSTYDGHTTEEKYRRLAALAKSPASVVPPVPPPESQDTERLISNLANACSARKYVEDGVEFDVRDAKAALRSALSRRPVTAEARPAVDWPSAITLALGEVDHHEGDICLKFAARVKAIALDEHDEDEEFRS